MTKRTKDTEFEGLMPLDALLCVLLEGSASAKQKQEFLDLVASDPRFSGQNELVLKLRGAIFGEELDLGVLQDFLAQLSAEDGWGDFAECLREDAHHTSSTLNVNLADAIMAAVVPESDASEDVAEEDARALMISRLFDGELSVDVRTSLAPQLESDVQALAALNDYATLGRFIREAVDEHSRRVDLSGIWAGVAPSIGLADPEEVPGWAPIGSALAEAVREHGVLDATQQAALAASIMVDVEAHAAHMAGARNEAPPKPASKAWFRWAVPTFAMAAAAAALLFTPIFGDGVDGSSGEESSHIEYAEMDIEYAEMYAEMDIEYAEMDEASLDELEFADDVFVHVMTAEDDDGPLIIMIDEDVAVAEFEEDDGVWDTGMEPI
jgi:hypothetical protein